MSRGASITACLFGGGDMKQGMPQSADRLASEVHAAARSGVGMQIMLQDCADKRKFGMKFLIRYPKESLKFQPETRHNCLWVRQVARGSRAEKLGIEGGQCIVRINGVYIGGFFPDVRGREKRGGGLTTTGEQTRAVRAAIVRAVKGNDGFIDLKFLRFCETRAAGRRKFGKQTRDTFQTRRWEYSSSFIAHRSVGNGLYY